MTKKDYVLIADVMYRMRPTNIKEQTRWNITVNALANVLSTTNPLFDRSRFIQACGSTNN